MRKSLAQMVEQAGYTIHADGTITGKRGNILKPWLQTSGYQVVNIVFKKGTRTTTLVHRIIASKYCPCSDQLANDVNHKDGDKTNNVSSNLEWITRRQNRNHYLGFEDYMTLTANDARRKNNERTIARRKLLKQLNK
ncbi:hypothetical protein [Salmonella phage vB_SenAt-pSL2]|uniref:HNH homing endonuclease n=1 Tax=Escherichia phage UAB_Phi78 TaxID=979726 RepID=A0A9K0IGB3_9CAUD|nr:HNH endonuclease [Escherichia phage UAB_Phi78]ADW95215.2 HNH homing endonuclease [Escherichia phage UAB_Phi78]QZQ75059.1 hypothetical protein [Salmonella phage vB_SenAt-pSL2]HBL6576683.1 HNH endonuclease [Salmonella enterica subsp. enterica serovar Typhimurium]